MEEKCWIAEAGRKVKKLGVGVCLLYQWSPENERYPCENFGVLKLVL